MSRGMGGRKRAVFLISIFLFSWFYLAPPCFAQSKIIAIVNNEIVTQKDLDDFVNFIRLDLQAEYKGEALEKKIHSIKADLLNKLIDDRLVLQEAKKSNIRIDEKRVEARINEIKKRYSTDTAFQSALIEQGLVQADIEARIREQFLMFAVIEQKVRSQATVNPVEVTAFYEKNLSEFRVPEQREFQAIIIGDEALAKEIYNQLKSGADLGALVKKHNLEANKITASQGKELRKDIEDIVFRLKEGEFSLPTKIQEGFYIFKLNAVIPPRQQDLSEAREKIYAFLQEQKMQEALAKLLNELKKNSYIKIFPN